MALTQGMLVGFSIAAPVGAIGIMCAEYSLHYGWLAGLIAGLGAATADTFYGAAVAFGAKSLSGLLTAWGPALKIAGGLILLYLGGTKLLSPPALASKLPHAGAKSKMRIYLTILGLTGTNPATIIDFSAVLMAWHIDLAGRHAPAIFVLGCFIGSMLWWGLLAIVVETLRGRLSPLLVRGINYLVGALSIALGFSAILGAL